MPLNYQEIVKKYYKQQLLKLENAKKFYFQNQIQITVQVGGSRQAAQTEAQPSAKKHQSREGQKLLENFLSSFLQDSHGLPAKKPILPYQPHCTCTVLGVYYTPGKLITDLKSVNLQYNVMVRWVAGTNDSSTKRLMFQVLFFFS